MTYFINCAQTLITFNKPSLTELIKQDNVYESQQEFFANYILKIVSVLTSREKKSSKKKCKSEDEGPNLGTSLADDFQEKPSPVKDERDLKESKDTMFKIVKQPSSADFSDIFKPYFEKLSLTAQLYENRDLRQVQLLLMTQLSNRYSKCKYLSNDYSDKINRIPGRVDPKTNKAVKPHHNPALIEQLTSMGFSSSLAKKALKMTMGELNQAVGLLLQGTDSLNGVSDSDEFKDEPSANEQAAQKAREEELAK